MTKQRFETSELLPTARGEILKMLMELAIHFFPDGVLAYPRVSVNVVNSPWCIYLVWAQEGSSAVLCKESSEAFSVLSLQVSSMGEDM